MKLVSFVADLEELVGVVVGDRVLDLCAASSFEIMAPMMLDLLPGEDLMAMARGLLRRARREEEFAERFCRPLADVELLAPVPRPGKILCLGRNYAAHAAEDGVEVPQWPVIFSKPASAVIGPGQTIRLPAVSEQLDYEAELAVVIGRPARNIDADVALDYVAGYTILNDVSVRDYQMEKGGGQWTLGKSFDTCCPIGPWLMTADEVPEPHALDIECTVSGERMQSANTSDMIFTVPFIIEYLSRCMTLEPGDVIATGTPEGVGAARTPPRWLRDGDVVECTVRGVGMLRNPVSA